MTAGGTRNGEGRPAAEEAVLQEEEPAGGTAGRQEWPAEEAVLQEEEPAGETARRQEEPAGGIFRQEEPVLRTEEQLAEERAALRKRHRVLRAAMTQREVEKKSRAICQRLLQTDWYPSCRIIYGYYPLGKEADCRAFLEQALAAGRRVALPRMGDGARMDFYEISSLEQVAEGVFHVMEPLPDCEMMQTADAVVLVPGVVFDHSGGRYGYGKGCYDRYFARFPGLTRVGIAYENQMEPHLTQTATDVRMHAVVTEERIRFGQGDSQNRIRPDEA